MRHRPSTPGLARHAPSRGQIAPAPAVAVAASYRGLGLVHVVEPPAYHGVTKRLGRYELALEEVLRG